MTWDYVIVGAGSAGCVLAARLTEDRDVRVLLLEAGPADRGWKIRMPAALTYNLGDDKFNWYYETEPQPFMNGRRMYWPRGRVLGGSSSLNAMVYVRGHAADYDRWAAEGAAGWSYAEVLPYFRKAETRNRPGGGDAYRGGEGPLKVSTGTQPNPLFQAFIDAGVEAGYGFTADMNGWRQEGFGRMDMTIHGGERMSAARAYLREAMTRPNLTVETGALATRVVFEGHRAVGVEWARKGALSVARASREVVLCGGAINSPQLLMLSGIGPADHLRSFALPVVQDLPGVGQNLQDHLEMYIQHESKKPITLYKVENPLIKLKVGIEWFLLKRGLASSAHLEAGGFIRSRPGVPHPDIQYHFLPSVVNDHGRQPGDRHAFQVHVGTMREQARGWIALKSADPKVHPRLQPNYLSTEQDRADMRACVRLTREIFAQPAFDPFRGPEIQPGASVKTDDEIDAFVRAKADSAYHPSCTCRMGVDAMCVVDPQARVYGVEGLRVVDASIMPSVVSGNLNAPTIMMAEKCADMIRGRAPEPASDAPVWQAPEWQTRQRAG